MVIKTAAQFLVGMMTRWIGTYLIKMKKKLMEPPEHSVSFYSNLSANDTLHVQQALVLIMIVICVDWI